MNDYLFMNSMSIRAVRHIFEALIFCFFLFFGNLSAQNYTIILGRPTDKSVTASILFDKNTSFYVEYGTKSDTYVNTTPTMNNSANTPDGVEIQDLLGNTKYFYRLRYKLNTGSTFLASPEYSFHTQRAKGSTFRFLVEADEHLYDKKGIRSLYKICLENQAKDSADFLLSLGDIFGDDHTPDATTSADMDFLHKDYLQYLGAVCHSLPFYVCLGNHEGESGYYLKQNPPNNIAVYGTQWRKFYYPNPLPNTFYSGNGTQEPYGIGQPENYFAWTWGDALFIVLDVYRDCDINEKPQNWDWTLGKTQYDWLKKSLETSSAKYKFVFAHHTRGQGRGAVKTAKGYEWGGYELNKNKWEFDVQRPGWEMPIHQLMVKHGVQIFFQGHDHFFGKQIKDCLIYQETPQPSHPNFSNANHAANYGYFEGQILPNSGHLRVTVNADGTKVEYVRAYLPQNESGSRHNKDVSATYFIGVKNCYDSLATGVPVLWNADYSDELIYPNPFDKETTIEFSVQKPERITLSIYDEQGKFVRMLLADNSISEGKFRIVWDGNDGFGNALPNGVYWYLIQGKSDEKKTGKIILSR